MPSALSLSNSAILQFMVNMMLLYEDGTSGRLSPTSFLLSNIDIIASYDAG